MRYYFVHKTPAPPCNATPCCRHFFAAEDHETPPRITPPGECGSKRVILPAEINPTHCYHTPQENAVAVILCQRWIYTLCATIICALHFTSSVRSAYTTERSKRSNGRNSSCLWGLQITSLQITDIDYPNSNPKFNFMRRMGDM